MDDFIGNPQYIYTPYINVDPISHKTDLSESIIQKWPQEIMEMVWFEDPNFKSTFQDLLQGLDMYLDPFKLHTKSNPEEPESEPEMWKDRELENKWIQETPWKPGNQDQWLSEVEKSLFPLINEGN